MNPPPIPQKRLKNLAPFPTLYNERMTANQNKSKLGVIIANTGSPDAPTPESVRAYLGQFLRDPRICPMNPLFWEIILRAFVLSKRSRTSAEKYQRIWTNEGSPLVACMARLSSRLQNELHDAGTPCEVRHAMSYGKPSMESALKELRDAGCKDLLVVPLYPQGAYSTTKVVSDNLIRALDALDWRPNAHLVEDYCTREDYVRTIAGSVMESGFDPTRDKLLFAFHSIPMKDISAGDAYGERVHDSVAAISEELNLQEGDWRLGFQCRFDKCRKWLGPTTHQILTDFPTGQERLFVIAPNFSIDCLETILDIDINLRGHFQQNRKGAADSDFVYIPCLNDQDGHVSLLARIVQEEQAGI